MTSVQFFYSKQVQLYKAQKGVYWVLFSGAFLKAKKKNFTLWENIYHTPHYVEIIGKMSGQSSYYKGPWIYETQNCFFLHQITPGQGPWSLCQVKCTRGTTEGSSQAAGEAIPALVPGPDPSDTLRAETIRRTPGEGVQVRKHRKTYFWSYDLNHWNQSCGLWQDGNTSSCMIFKVKDPEPK